MPGQRPDEAELLRYLNALRSRISQMKQGGLMDGDGDAEQSDQIFQAIFENAADGILLTDVESKRFYIGNRLVCQMLGYGLQELRTLALADIHPEESLSYVTERFTKQVTEELTLAKDIPIKRKDGSVFYADINSFPIVFGRKTYLMSIIRDITQRRFAEQELRRSEEKFRLAMEATNDALWDWNIATNEVYRNPRHATMLGYEPHELTASQEEWEKRIHPDDKPLVLRLVDEHLAGKRDCFNVEYRLRKKSGDYIWVLGRGRVVAYDDDGSPTRMVGTNVDVTERKIAEEKLKKSEEQFREIFEHTAVGMYRTTPDGRILMANPALVRMLGYSSFEELARRELEQEGFEPQYPRRIFKERIDRNGQIRGLESAWVRRDGTILTIIENARAVRDEYGNILYYEGTADDITERKKAENELRKFKTIADRAGYGVGIIDMDCRFIYLNNPFAEMHGYQISELMGKHVSILHNQEQMERVDQLIQQVRTSDTFISEEVWRIRKDGTEFCALMNGTFIGDEHGEPQFMAATAIDITHRKNIETALAESEEKYRTLVECAGDSIATIDKDGVLLFANKKAEEDLGYEREALIGKTMWDIFPKEIANRQMVSVREVIETRQGKNVVSVSEIKGRRRWYSTTIEPLRDSRGNVAAAMIVARDVDHIKQAEERIRILSSAVEQSTDGIAIGDKTKRLQYVNAAYARMYGYEPEEMIGMHITDVHHEQEPDDCSRHIRQVATQGFWTGEVKDIRKDGTLFLCQISISSLRDVRGQIAGSLAVCRDITESRKKEEELAAYREQMARTEQLVSLGTLSATIAHQVTQPLTVIRLSLDNVVDELERTSCSSTVMRRLQDSIAQVSNITSIINRFRSFARQSSDTGFGQVSVQTVVVRVARLLAESARQSRVTLHIEAMRGLPPVFLQERDFEQILFALLENAIQSADGKQARRVVISGLVKNDHIELRFRDNCGGIPPKNLDRIFEPFFTTKPRSQGTGLGLCIVRDAVERAGGSVRVESEFGKGSTFYVTLPTDGE